MGEEKLRKYVFTHFIVDTINNLYISNRVSIFGNKVYASPNYDNFYASIPGVEVRIADRLGKEVSKDNVDFIIAKIMLEYNRLIRPIYVTKQTVGA